MKLKLVLLFAIAIALAGARRWFAESGAAGIEIESPSAAEPNQFPNPEFELSREDSAPSLGRDFNAECENRLQEWLQTGPSENWEAALVALLQDWIQHDALAAAECVGRIESESRRLECLRQLLWLWADLDAAAAIVWARQLDSGGELALTQIYSRVAESDPASAIALLSRDDAPPAGALASAVVRWAEADLATAASWVQRQPAGPEREEWVLRIALVQSRANPQVAASLVVEQIPPGKIQVEAAIAVVHQWALRDLEQAARWVAAFPEGAVRARALAELEGVAHYRAMSAN